jgi:heme-degrading monooxygenase HmoA
MYIWEFLAAPGKAEDFARVYGPEGDWVRLFRRAPGYIKSELHRDAANPRRFITIDYWESEAAWNEFKVEYTADYEDLDVKCEEFTVRESQLGRFTRVG